MKRSLGFVLGLVCGAMILSDAALAGQKPESKRSRPPAASFAEQAAAKASQQAAIKARLEQSPDTFGIGCCQVLQVPASSFVPVSGATYVNDDLEGYTTVTAFGSTFDDLMATVTLPSGSLLSYIDLYFQDTNVASDLAVTLYRLGGGNNGFLGSGAPFYSLVGSVASFGSAGYDYSVASVVHTVLNNVAYDVNSGQYTIYVSFPVTDGTLAFKGVDLWWQRQLSPAPVVPTFGDVPDTDFGYAYIEALVASGITGGTAPGVYSPDNFVTRRQMAIFIAKALGIYWPF